MDRLIGNKLEKQNNVVDFDLSDVVINKKKVYEEIADQIRERIINGQFKPGDKLPSERLLAKNFGVSVPTIRQALGTLSATGYIKIIHGSGTFVTSYQTSPFLDLFDKKY
ncbi:FadR/GntR family transcriptional regulator [Atribacter laminatus]|uniref:Mannosyl-D-glycerate transport/metabolism system repressor MngR n=1 Tax=Atribacter laminatus TaxID=2847778 RepID=A0A7T1AJ17_ATRLM|nr:winged helix-turn-helix domain-containing protein [Atribacter laminatus]QPM66828.1 Mannosyl-D-glycerate transport/metabolism system repressor MngR [Atribacter laminatus]